MRLQREPCAFVQFFNTPDLTTSMPALLSLRVAMACHVSMVYGPICDGQIRSRWVMIDISIRAYMVTIIVHASVLRIQRMMKYVFEFVHVSTERRRYCNHPGLRYAAAGLSLARFCCRSLRPNVSKDAARARGQFNSRVMRKDCPVKIGQCRGRL
jgi:hypothetical protein